MPLFWSTDKIIAGKYRVKKPIPVKAELNSVGFVTIRMFNMTLGNIDNDIAEEIILEAISRKLTGEGIDYNDVLLKPTKPIHEEFNKYFMEYLEEIK